MSSIDVQAARAQTPGVSHRTHLNNAGAGLLTQRTLDVMCGHLELEATIGGYEAEELRRPEIRSVYAGLGRLLGGRPDEIALFDNSTHAFNAAFYSLPMRPGDRIVTCRAEYGSNVLAYLQRAEREGVEVVVAPDDALGEVDVEALAALVDDRTKLIGISHIPTGGGLVNPAERIGAVARAAGVPFLLDATQSIGQLRLDVRSVGADFVTGTGRKFLRGPRGIGFLWVRAESLDLLDPYVNEIEASTWDGARGFRWHDGSRRLETWERSCSNVLGLGAAVDQALEWGMPAIEERALSLASRLRDGLDAVPGVSTHDLGARRCAIVTAAVAGVPAAEVSQRLREKGINTSVTEGDQNQFDQEVRPVHPLVRLSPHYYNTEHEIDSAIDAVARIAAER